jgi:hypothetical protein
MKLPNLPEWVTAKDRIITLDLKPEPPKPGDEWKPDDTYKNLVVMPYIRRSARSPRRGAGGE